MEKENIEVDYDKHEDIISLFKKGNKSKFSFDIALPKGDFIIDYGFNGNIVGIEFFNASSYFPFLKDIEDVNAIKASMSVQYGMNWAQISYKIYAPGMKQPIVNIVNAPYNKELILEN